MSKLLCKFHVNGPGRPLFGLFCGSPLRYAVPMFATVRILTSMLALVAGWGTGVLALLGAAWGV